MDIYNFPKAFTCVMITSRRLIHARKDFEPVAVRSCGVRSCVCPGVCVPGGNDSEGSRVPAASDPRTGLNIYSPTHTHGRPPAREKGKNTHVCVCVCGCGCGCV